MKKSISKSAFKPKAFEYLRMVSESQSELIITEHGKPVLKIVPYSDSEPTGLESMRGLIEKYIDPEKPVGSEDWEILK